MSKGTTILHHPLKLCDSCNSGDKGNCQNNKSFFAVVRALNTSYKTAAKNKL